MQPINQIGGTVNCVALSGSLAVFEQGADVVIADVSNLNNPVVVEIAVF